VLRLGAGDDAVQLARDAQQLALEAKAACEEALEGSSASDTIRKDIHCLKFEVKRLKINGGSGGGGGPDVATAENAALHEELKRLRRRAAKSATWMDELEASVMEAREAVAKLRADAKSALLTLKHAITYVDEQKKAELEDLHPQIDSLVKEVTKQKKLLKETNQRLEQTRIRVRETEEDTDERLEKTAERLDQISNRLKETEQATGERLGAAFDRLDEAEETLGKVHFTVMEEEGDVKKELRRLRRGVDTIPGVMDDVDALKEDVAQLDELRADVALVKRSVKAAKKEAEQAMLGVGGESETVQSLRTEMDCLKKQVEAKRQSDFMKVSVDLPTVAALQLVFRGRQPTR
jgi:chromosome segregation ATPase